MKLTLAGLKVFIIEKLQRVSTGRAFKTCTLIMYLLTDVFHSFGSEAVQHDYVTRLVKMFYSCLPVEILQLDSLLIYFVILRFFIILPYFLFFLSD